MGSSYVNINQIKFQHVFVLKFDALPLVTDFLSHIFLGGLAILAAATARMFMFNRPCTFTITLVVNLNSDCSNLPNKVSLKPIFYVIL